MAQVGWYGAGVTLHDHTDANNGGQLGLNTVGTTQLVDANVTTAKIADQNVTTAKIADGNITATKYQAQSIGQASLAKPAIGTPELKTSTGSASVGTGVQITVAMNDYAFGAMIGGELAGIVKGGASDLGSTVQQVSIDNSIGVGAEVLRWRYVTA